MSQNKQQEIQYLSNEIENLQKQNEEMSRWVDYQMTSEQLEWLSSRTGIALPRLQEIHQNTLRMLSRMRLQYRYFIIDNALCPIWSPILGIVFLDLRGISDFLNRVPKYVAELRSTFLNIRV